MASLAQTMLSHLQNELKYCNDAITYNLYPEAYIKLATRKVVLLMDIADMEEKIKTADGNQL